ncbi:aspartyl/glutamyl-tRNA(Asn/Gln) amidotransferase subunit C [Sulfodiicoccus acidiphilus]|uniref:Aspartyl/glutamyl-tRNA(Asn/Gln) amidotransferase subunit C n=1 Tax=Sulfodiicoccus acidiphilus TaxID=1670455 RepID=A0A348B370_9CREN|nr:Asp-tRNA(Asn) amidotransferase subunit GatC [Sulfodiicoccus acidiphilus]BBD72622.1 aspartyl/glutamyl-tRNA(Asn/Gln) amidotransferase subunit C [Sulfodiicoccus acidiphilus]GGT93258.1 aspartyl/glutamyl-tRNA(Asn/Gln) amidotransferase subunit C [Sulfodiicoccus acidiphilus]
MKIEVDEELVKRLESLSLIELKGEEREEIKEDLEKILAFFSKLDQLDLSEVEPTFHPVSGGKMRKDEPEDPLPVNLALSNAKRTREGYIVGPKTFGE